MLFEIHMLKNYPVTNLNRDESGTPKTCYFGGSQRGRISSQCLKRSWRTSGFFKSMESYASRSRGLPSVVEEKLLECGIDKESAVAFVEKIPALVEKKSTGSNGKKKEKKTKNGSIATGQTIFFSPADVDALVKIACEKYKTGKLNALSADDISTALLAEDTRAITMDIALFGRMVTSAVFVDVEAAMQVAHAISTHPVNLESDFYTAVDDLLELRKDVESDKGADMMGDVDYNSCCYYIYASLDVDKLKENLKNSPDALAKIDQIIPVLLRTMAFTDPSGMQNTLAGHVRPEVVLVECKREKIPLSYANAYAEAVSRTSRKVVQDSTDKLVAEVDLMDRYYGCEVAHRGWMAVRSENSPEHCESFTGLDQLIEACAAWAKE